MASWINTVFGGQFTIGELMNIDQGRQQRAALCSVRLDKVFHEIKQESLIDRFRSFFFNKRIINVYYIVLKLTVTSPGSSAKKVFIKLDPDFNLQDWMDNKVQIYCDCPDFKFRSAYILSRRNSLFTNDRVKVELGPARVDSPKSKSKTSFLCKHSFAALNWVISNYQSIMRSI